ncbi:hypothetical protein [Mesorhizobium sp. L-8-3]|uniref:hypothetical protein n=1 Tax=Mesorhizobium sp. L-8-3 TaxID=2744522 RepID=UPI00192710BA|nr:hypothetical protein [Mesorhizobium sp. L-8-3]BCH24948.1 hypothetical protein MesoLjLb_47330 [Mesorhizobium sp. L-8-3]
MEHEAAINPAAPHHLPFFIAAPGQTDVLFVATGIVVLLAVVGIGIFYFKLHALPEQMAHRGQKVQFEIVAVLALIALFTHNHAFWIAALLLALVPLPDFSTPLNSMAQSLGRMAGRREPDVPAQADEPAVPAAAAAEPLPLGQKRA